MRLLTVYTDDGTAVHVDDGDGARVVRASGGGTYADVQALLGAGTEGDRDARRALEDSPMQIDPARIARPVLAPGAVICVGLNYRSHILEMKRELPTVPTLFSKLPRALTDPFAEIELPSYSDQLDYEGELGVVIGRGGRDISLDDAWSAVAGLTVVNDVSVRDWQWRTPQWFAGKTGQSLTPVGPVIVTTDEFSAGIADLRLRVTVNDQPRQDALLGDLVIDVPSLVADISRVVELRAGDIIATGTPGGVAAGMSEPRWLVPGDVVEVSIDRIGTIRNRVRAGNLTREIPDPGGTE
jgi:acylpyruvate hydrolase